MANLVDNIKTLYYEALRARDPIKDHNFILDTNILSNLLNICSKHDPSSLLKLPESVLLSLSPSSYGLWLHVSRISLNLTQESIAKQSGITQCEVSILERGVKKTN